MIDSLVDIGVCWDSALLTPLAPRVLLPMLSLYDRPLRLCDGLSRREWLRVGSLASGLSLADLLAARQTQAAPTEHPQSFGKAKACIVLFMLGGPPQHETWDPKPDAPVEVRGSLKPIASRTPGLLVGELMPRTAQLTDRIGVLRAVSTRDNAHSSSGYWMLTGRPHVPLNTENAKPGAPNDAPSLAAVVQHLLKSRGALPSAVRLPEEIWNTGRIVWPGQDGGFLGPAADPWLLTCDPNKPDFAVPGVSLPSELPPLVFDARRKLLEQINGHFGSLEQRDALAGWNHIEQQAFDLIHSRHGGRAFRLEDEPAAVRDRYGRHRFGQSVLLARRMIESGVSLVQVNWTRGETDTADSPAWDTHGRNEPLLRTSLMPPMDAAYSALLEDLEQRGLLDETLVVWMGEFGRTPKINARGGRDHWGHVFSVALAGGGIQGGRVIGQSDELAGYPKAGRHEPQDIAATILHLLGISPETLVYDRQRRPIAVSHGRVIESLV